ncbi:hypothetical protein Hanom_Chr03g00251481 [Helianthus anomalus]
MFHQPHYLVPRLVPCSPHYFLINLDILKQSVHICHTGNTLFPINHTFYPFAFRCLGFYYLLVDHSFGCYPDHDHALATSEILDLDLYQNHVHS